MENTCAMCGVSLAGRRSHAQVCSSTCRSRLRYERKKQNKLMSSFGFSDVDRQRFQRVMRFSPTSAITVRELLEKEGYAVARVALLAVEQAIFRCEVSGLRTGYLAG